MASSSPGARSWRTAFLTLRDETLAPPPPHALLSLLRDLVLSHPSGALAAAAAAAADLPPHEVTSDVMLLAELALAVSKCPDADGALISILHLIHDISCRVHLEVNSSWIMLLNFLEEVLDCVHGSAYRKSFSSRTASVNALTECLAILRLIVKAYGRTNLSIESSQLVRILISIISCLHGELLNSYQSNGADISPRDTGTRSMRYNSLWEMQTLALSMVGDILSWTDSSLSANLWQSIVEVLRKVMDFLASKNLFIENNGMSRFYATLLHCLHLVLSEPKGSLSGHVAGFVATLQMFFMYGLPSRSSIPPAAADLKEKVGGSQDLRSGPSRRNDHGTYRPPHLRKREETRTNSMDLQSSSDCESSRYDFTSSDSDHSDSDGYAKIGDRFRSSKARLAAISCIQDLCHADPKLLTSLWSLLLPEKDVLEPRKYQATLMTSLIFDPVMKIRIEAASTIAAMVEGHAVVLSQVAEYKETSKCGSFTTLSSSLGQILMQLHTGILYLIRHETHSGLLAGLFKMLILVISATPYARMPRELLPTVLQSLCTRIFEDHAVKKEQYTLLALRAVSHNYPSTVKRTWKQVLAIINDLLQIENLGDLSYGVVSRSLKGDIEKTVGSTAEKSIVAGIKVLDACLRAASGFKGAGDLLECRLLDIQQDSDYTKKIKISSAPSYELESSEALESYTPDILSGILQWNEAIKMLLPRASSHTSPMVRAAAITCFAGMTSAVFFSLTEDKQEFILSTSVGSEILLLIFGNQISRVLNDIIHAAEFNTHDPVVSVRITASWALANICDSLRYNFTELRKESYADELTESIIPLLAESALRLTKDGDKIKSNAVRALGNLSRFIKFDDHSSVTHLPRYLRTLCSSAWFSVSITWRFSLARKNGASVCFMCDHWNVKVQWNVCHALSNLFMNEALKLHEVSWAPAVFSILLLLLRDSTNYKIRIHAAVALAVPASRLDYGSSFSDILQGLINVLESLNSNYSSSPSSFKYKGNLEKQLMFSTLHVLGFISSTDDQALKDFLVKKASFLEEWLKLLLLSLKEEDNHPSASKASNGDKQEDGGSSLSYVPNKMMLFGAINSLLDLYKRNNHQTIAQRFENLASNLYHQ
ncbi:HEAT repeat-containing protein 6 [Ananas comosus]|uniref:HEAT repeat-containing protein 6 n=1 Tax=Ananas comosus TaxID=4615 RepID=A0A199VPH8_ANACO|nr:HEAT repeat-containing protein 6 [Ananas comosus]